MGDGWLFLPGGRGERGQVEKGKVAFASTAMGNLKRQGGLQDFAREGKESTRVAQKGPREILLQGRRPKLEADVGRLGLYLFLIQ